MYMYIAMCPSCVFPNTTLGMVQYINLGLYLQLLLARIGRGRRRERGKGKVYERERGKRGKERGEKVVKEGGSRKGESVRQI